jgi:hypothetical protein
MPVDRRRGIDQLGSRFSFRLNSRFNSRFDFGRELNRTKSELQSQPFDRKWVLTDQDSYSLA